jgi:hypothetical protein
MTDSERLNEVLKTLKINAKELSIALGFDRPNALYQVLNGKNGISRSLANRIISKFPMFSFEWLRNDKPPMIIPKAAVRSIPDSISIVSDQPVGYISDLSRIIKAIEERDKQIDILINQLVEKDKQIGFMLNLLKDKP